MKTQRVLVVLTVLNFAMLALNLLRSNTTAHAADDAAPALRGRSLEIVDDHGHARVTLTVIPADPNAKLPGGGTGYPETVLMRLIDGRGKPQVKIEATDQGAGIAVFGKDDPTHSSMFAQGDASSIELKGKQGAAKVIKP